MSDTSDPVRWIEPGAGSPEPMARLLRDAQRDFPAEAQLAAIARRIDAEIGAGAAPALPSGSRGLGRFVGGLAVVGALAGVGVFLARTQPNPVAPPHTVSPRPIPAPEPVPSAPVAAPPPGAIEPAPPSPPSPAPEASSAALPRDEKRPAKSPTGLGEAELLERARRALKTDPSRALALAQEHKRRFARGVLAQEREVIAIDALRRLERDGEAKRRAESFEQRYPDSAHRRAVEQGLGK